MMSDALPLGGCGTHTRAVDPISECTFLLMPVKVCTGAPPYDPARYLRCLSAGDLHLSGGARLSKDAGSLIPFPGSRQHRF